MPGGEEVGVGNWELSWAGLAGVSSGSSSLGCSATAGGIDDDAGWRAIGAGVKLDRRADSCGRTRLGRALLLGIEWALGK